MPLRWHVRRKSLTPETVKWGLFGVAVSSALTYGNGNVLGR